MIVVDASAFLAILFAEPERDAFVERMIGAPALAASPVNIWEVFVRAEVVLGVAGRNQTELLISALGVDIPRIGIDDARAAASAFRLYGRRTPANLNLADCFAYALAKRLHAPLLYKGEDFGKTDVVAA